jgi:hypothetical protein
MRITLLAVVILMSIFLTACAKPLPPDKLAYAGDWESPSLYLQITPGGQVSYKRVNGNQSTSIDAPVKDFQGDNVEVGVGPATTVFVVSKPPHQDQGAWKMTVDGVELTRQN